MIFSRKIAKKVFLVERYTNRGFSSLACCLTVMLYRIGSLRKRKVKKGPKIKLSWSKAVKEKSIFYLAPFLFYKLYWRFFRGGRNFIQKRFDQLICIDWDLLRKWGKGIEVDSYEENARLSELTVCNNIPSLYLRSERQGED
jgi:hypothetical protein